MKLSAFITAHLPAILAEWDAFARTLFPFETGKSNLALRDHAEQMLRELAADIDTDQSTRQQIQKSKGLEGPDSPDSAAAIHGTLREHIGFSLVQLAAEFRALRATVLRLWLREITHVTEDISYDMVRFNEAVDQALAESVATYSVRTNRTRDTFLAILGHDLRTPLSVMSLSGHYLRRPGFGTEETRETGQRIVANAASMRSMVNDLLEYGRSQLGGEMSISRQQVDMAQVCQAALDDARAAYSDLEFAFDVQGEATGQFDGARLQQVYSNLLINAAQYGIAGRGIKMTLHGQRDGVTVQVCNFGPVIPAEFLDAMFDPLVQLAIPGLQRTFSSSSGLGLFIAREITNAHAGKISVSSSLEAGTIFTVWLPRASP